MLDAMPDAKATAHAWGPKPALLVFAGAGAVAALVLAVLAAEPAGRLLFAVATIGLAAAAVGGVRARPRLVADPAGLTIRGWRGPRRLTWDQVAQWEVVTLHRLGRRVPVLELTVREGDRERLVLFGRMELDADPVDVLEVLRRTRRAGSRGDGQIGN